jgi:ferredoxin--NADP+ reductase
MDAMQDKYTIETIIEKRLWTTGLFSFRTSRNRAFRFVPGQFARLGLRKPDGTTVWRAYSMVSAPYDEHLEFFSIVVPDGEFTTRLAQLDVGDAILVDKTAFGFLTTDRFRPARDLWLLATGTGLAPFLSILQDPAIWADYENVIVVHSVRTAAELTYRDEMQALVEHPLLGDAARRLRYVPVVTRERPPGTLDARIPALIRDGRLEATVGIRLDTGQSRIMICGNPDMVRDTRTALKERGFALSRRERPGQLAVENAF